jgi:hypothetical protein
MTQNRRFQLDEIYNTNLFTVRLWYEHLGENVSEWRGRVEHVPSKEARYFREWSTLIAFLQEVPYQQNFLKDLNQTDIQSE